MYFIIYKMKRWFASDTIVDLQYLLFLIRSDEWFSVNKFGPMF